MAEDLDALEKLAPERVVDNRVYTDPRVYELELERVFSRSWILVCHESELREAGDFLTVRVAENPLLLVRDRNNRVRAFYNTCRHRGSKVVLDESGHCAAFRCPYHYWTYSLEGDLVGIPGEEAYDGTGFDKESFPLVSVACDSLFGLVFVHLGPSPEPLRDWLGPEIVDALARPLAGAELEVFSQRSTRWPLNWKIFAENARDGYHVPFVHPFFRKASPPGVYRLHRHGHAVQELGMDPEGMEPELWARLSQAPLPGVEVGEGYIANLFPDVAITLRSNVVSIDIQHLDGPTGVIMHNRTLGLVGDDDDTRALRRLSQETWFQNPVEMEDLPVFLAQQEGVSSRGVRYSVIARGADAATGRRGDDNRLRHFWVEWRALMGTARNSVEEI